MELRKSDMRLVKQYLLLLVLLPFCGAAMAQNVVLDVDAPAMVASGKPFKVEYTVNSKPERFIAPSLDGFDVLAGPTYSEGRQISIINGNVNQVENYIYTYVIIANDPGNRTIPTAKVVVDGKEYASKSLPIEVVDEQSSVPQQQPQGDRQPENRGQQQSTQELAADDILIRAIVDKRNVYKGQPVRVAFKLYTRVPIAGIQDVKYPSFNGFWTQELDADRYSAQRETYNSKIYETRVLKEYLLFPQQSGTLNIEQMDITAVAQIVVQSQRQTIFDDIFGGMADIKQVSRKVSTSQVSVRVNDWPSGAPAGFNGAVGNFTMNSDYPDGSIAANSSANFIIRITGTGNLPLVQAPRLELPTSFEQYNVKTTESLNKTTGGISGYRQFEYPVIPRAEGDFYIEPVNFTFFNPETAKYVTLSTREHNISVLPDSTMGVRSAGPQGIVTGLSKEDIRMLGEDIRFIKLGSAGLSAHGSMFMGSVLYFLLLILLVAAFVFVLIYLQKRIKEMRNVAAVRGKKANRVALQRLKSAESYMKEGIQRGFYEEMLKALWGYMGDKLNIPVAILTKENVREELLKRNISADQVSRYIDLITECEYAQYSPAGSGQMNEIYGHAVESISKLESLIKK